MRTLGGFSPDDFCLHRVLYAGVYRTSRSQFAPITDEDFPKKVAVEPRSRLTINRTE